MQKQTSLATPYRKKQKPPTHAEVKEKAKQYDIFKSKARMKRDRAAANLASPPSRQNESVTAPSGDADDESDDFEGFIPNPRRPDALMDGLLQPHKNWMPSQREAVWKKPPDLHLSSEQEESILNHIHTDYNLDEKQTSAVQFALRGESFFLTGAAGTGKSYTLRAIIQALKNKFDMLEESKTSSSSLPLDRASRSLAICAPTGAAGLNVGGQTIHSWAGIGQGTDSAQCLLEKLTGDGDSQRRSRARWRNVRCLVIDEISLLSADLLHKLDFLASGLRNTEPGQFGDIQRIGIGDFYQLPPVYRKKWSGEKGDDDDDDDDGGGGGGGGVPSGDVGTHNPRRPNYKKRSRPRPDNIDPCSQYAFQNERWNQIFPWMLELVVGYRQSGDPGYIDALNEMRIGRPSIKTLAMLEERIRPIPGDITPVRLFATKSGVHEFNKARLRLLSAAPCFKHPNLANIHKIQSYFHIVYTARDDSQKYGPNVDALNSQFPAEAQIQLKVGARVILLKNQTDRRLVNGSGGEVIAFMTPTQYQEYLAQKSSGDDDGGPESANASWSFRSSTPVYLDFRACNQSVHLPLPLVSFDNGAEMLVEPAQWSIKQGDTVVASREQIPLILGWAITIHRSQGMTLSSIEVDLANVFTSGQAYSACARVGSLDKLYIRSSFFPSVIRADPVVDSFYKKHSNSESKETVVAVGP